MVSYSFYETDNRVRRYAETLAKSGYAVEALALRRDDTLPDVETIDGVTVHRLQGRQKNERNPLEHLLRHCRFALRVARHLFRTHRKTPYKLIHVHNPPDFITLAAWIPKRMGAKVILDIHDIVPELYGNKFQSPFVSLFTKALEWTERLSMRFADHVIVSNHLWHEKLTARSVPPEKASVFINHVDRTLFSPRPRSASHEKFVILFPGSLSRHQGLDIAIKAFSKIQHELPNAEFHIYGVGSAKEELVRLVAQLALQDKVLFRELVPLNQVADLMARAAIGVVPKRADSFGNEAYSTKIMEFMSQGTPVIVSRTKVDTYYFNENLVSFFEPENVDALAKCMLRLAKDSDYYRTLSENGLKYAEQNCWDGKQQEYLDLVTDLTAECREQPKQYSLGAEPTSGTFFDKDTERPDRHFSPAADSSG